MKIAIISLAFSVLALCGCSNTLDSAAEQPEKLTITGSSTIAPVIAEIAKTYEQSHPHVRIDVQTGGSSRGLSDVIHGNADIGMVSRHVDPTTQYKTQVIGRDGVTIIVHKDNPLKTLDKETITKIYQKKITNWKTLNGKDEDIVVVSKAEGRSTLTVFLGFLGLKNSDLKPDSIIGDNEQGIKLVSKNPKAIAYVSTSTAEYNQRHGVPIRSVMINEISPSIENIANGKFPIVRELNLIIPPHSNTLATSFLDYTRSDKAKMILEGFKFVPTI